MDDDEELITFESCRDNLELDDFIVFHRLTGIDADSDFHFSFVVLNRSDLPQRQLTTKSPLHIVIVLHHDGIDALIRRLFLSQTHLQNVHINARVLAELFRVNLERAIALKALRCRRVPSLLKHD